MTEQTPHTLKAVLCENQPQGRIAVDLEAFVKFDLLIDHELDSLVAQWEPLAAPKAARPPLRRLRSRKAK